MGLEAILAYRGSGIGAEERVPLGVTLDPAVLRALRDAVVEQARQEALRWKDVDEGIYALRAADFERLCKVAAWLMPDEDEDRPALHVVRRHRKLLPDAGPGKPT
jgi:hypothetical protein